MTKFLSAALLILLCQSLFGEDGSSTRSTFRVDMASEWNFKKSQEISSYLDGIADPYLLSSIDSFEKKLDLVKTKQYLHTQVRYTDFTRYFWLVNYKRTKINEELTVVSGILYEAIYKNNGIIDLGVFYRAELLDQPESADWAIRNSRDFPAITIDFSSDSNKVIIYLPGDIYNSTKEGRKNRYADEN